MHATSAATTYIRDPTQSNNQNINQVEELADAGVRCVSVSCGGKHTLALADDGTVWGWGDGEFGRLGNGRSNQPLPAILEELENVPCRQVAAGESFSAAVSRTGELYLWGKNDQSQLGLGANLTMDINSLEEYPVKSPFFTGIPPFIVPTECAWSTLTPVATMLLLSLSATDDRVVHLATGRHHCVVATESGAVYSWGARQHIEPVKMSVLDGVRCVQVAAGDDYSAALSGNIVVGHSIVLCRYAVNKRTHVLTRAVVALTLFRYRCAVHLGQGHQPWRPGPWQELGREATTCC